MRIALLQDEIYIPTFAGGIKANRLLLQSLAARGHHCLALTRALTRSPDGPQNRDSLQRELRRRGLTILESEEHVVTYRMHGVEVEALDHGSSEDRYRYLTQRLTAFQPDVILVADDKRRLLLKSAMAVAPDRVVPWIQTIIHLPFGPLAVAPDPDQTALLQRAPTVITISRYLQEYLSRHGSLPAHRLQPPVYGSPPYQLLADPSKGCVTMINPCELKGVSIFFELAQKLPRLDFAAVPTWGASEEILERLRSLPNVRLLRPADDIEEILQETRVLLVPSLWPETFGYVVPEAMLRGIPVLAADVGGLPEAKLGVDYLLPVKPAYLEKGSYVCPPQETAVWESALRELTEDPAVYTRCSQTSRQTAIAFVDSISIHAFEEVFASL